MFKSKPIFLTMALVSTAQPFFAEAQLPDVTECDAWTVYMGPGTPSLLVVPDGGGHPFTAAQAEEGNVVDATIYLVIRNGMGVLLVDYPYEDCWLESADQGMVPCVGGTVADQNSDTNGMTYWADPLFAGGYSQTLTRVLINGMALAPNPNVRYRSPDINGDLVVNLLDIALFSVDYFSGYHYRSDFLGDGELNLADIPIFAEHIGASCP